MLDAIYPDGTITWLCHNKACAFHETPLTARVEHTTVRYVCLDPGGAGAVILLPSCLCGSRLGVKADYTRVDLLSGKMLIEVPGMSGRIMKLEHVRNLLLHHLLFRAGKAPRGPMIPLPSSGALHYLAGMGASFEMVMTIWFTHYVAGEQMIALPGIDRRMLQPAATSSLLFLFKATEREKKIE